MKPIKRALLLILALVLVLGISGAALAADAGMSNFIRVNTYPDGKFADVHAGDWFAGSVKDAYELGLVKGESETAFSPAGSVNIAAAITLACRIHSIYNTGTADFIQGYPWYQVYVDYAVANGIIRAGEYTNMGAKATRVQYAAIMSKALPDSALVAINTVEDNAIPDVKMMDAHAADIYNLYRAGILTGSDSRGTFHPQSDIKRSEVAALVTRMADASLRKSVTLETGPLQYYQNVLDFFYNQVKSGWSNWSPDTNSSICSYMFPTLRKAASLSEVGFYFIDLDGNGIEELIVSPRSTSWGAGDGMIYDLYTYNEQLDSVIHLLTSGERERYYLGKDGTIYESGSSSANDSDHRQYEVTGGSLKLLRELVVNGRLKKPYAYGVLNDSGQMKWSFGSGNEYQNMASNWTGSANCRSFDAVKLSEYSVVDANRTWFSCDSHPSIRYPYNYIENILTSSLYWELTDLFKAQGVNSFFQVEFTDPRTMPIYQIVYQYKDSSVSSAAVRNAYIAAGRDYGIGLTYISSSTLDAFLKKYTGYGINDADWNFNECDYIKSLNVFSKQHGDTNYRPEIYYPESGIAAQNIYVDGDLITVVFSKGDVVTLRNMGNGNYRFVSHILPKDYGTPEWYAANVYF